MNPLIFTTKRLRLRQLNPSIYAHLFANLSDEELLEYLALADLESLAKEKEKFKKGFEAYDRSFEIFQIIRKEDNCILGMTGFVRWYPDHSRAEFGYALNHQDHYGKGYMTEANAPIIKYGFETLKLHRIEALVEPKNIASIKLIEKLGMEKEGFLKEHYCKNGVFEDSLIYAVLA